MTWGKWRVKKIKVFGPYRDESGENEWEVKRGDTDVIPFAAGLIKADATYIAACSTWPELLFKQYGMWNTLRKEALNNQWGNALKEYCEMCSEILLALSAVGRLGWKTKESK